MKRIASIDYGHMQASSRSDFSGIGKVQLKDLLRIPDRGGNPYQSWWALAGAIAVPVLVALGYCVYYGNLDPLYIVWVNFTLPAVVFVLAFPLVMAGVAKWYFRRPR